MVLGVAGSCEATETSEHLAVGGSAAVAAPAQLSSPTTIIGGSPPLLIFIRKTVSVPWYDVKDAGHVAGG